jgi:hypothetical protein
MDIFIQNTIGFWTFPPKESLWHRSCAHRKFLQKSHLGPRLFRHFFGQQPADKNDGFLVVGGTEAESIYEVVV